MSTAADTLSMRMCGIETIQFCSDEVVRDLGEVHFSGMHSVEARLQEVKRRVGGEESRPWE